MPSKSFKRREFIKINSALFLIPFLPASLQHKKYKPLLSFSTLGCPDWSFEKIVHFAAVNKYDGIEIRGILHEMDLTKAEPFKSKENIANSIQLMNDNKLKFSDLGSSAALHFPEGAERQKNLDEAKRFIDLAEQLNCPNVRVFPNDFPKDQDKNITKDLIAKGLLTLGNYANGTNVSVLLETHGEVVYTADLLQIMQAAAHAHVGMVWDAYNMWSVTKEHPESVYAALKNYIKHTHIKDARLINGKEQYVLLGTGDSAIFEAINVLAKNKFPGYYSFEWEKLWHPEIDEPEIALADYPKAMQRHFQKPPHISTLE
ncbi:MAG: sugar phosphate isomerase/epimerase family protein [Parafilimonas sp.]